MLKTPFKTMHVIQVYSFYVTLIYSSRVVHLLFFFSSKYSTRYFLATMYSYGDSGSESFCKWFNCMWRYNSQRGDGSRQSCKSKVAEFYVEEREPRNLYILFMPPREWPGALTHRHLEPLRLERRLVSLQPCFMAHCLESTLLHIASSWSFDFKAWLKHGRRSIRGFAEISKARISLTSLTEIRVLWITALIVS